MELRVWAIMSLMGLWGCGRIGYDEVSPGPFACAPGDDCLPGLVEAVYPIHGANWNDYVRNDDPTKDAYHQDDEACTDSDPPGRLSCLPAALMRRVALSGTSCNGRQGADALDVFDWHCDDQDDEPFLYSRGFKPGRGLRDLIDGDLVWRSNRIVVQSGGESFAGTDSVWWQNPFVSLADTAYQNGDPGTDTMVDLSQPSAIYVLSEAQSSLGYRIAADKISLVTLGGATLRYSGIGTSNCQEGTRVCLVVSPVGRKFVWVEGDFDAANGPAEQRGIYLRGTRFSRVHGVRVIAAGGYGVRLHESDSNVIDEVVAVGNDTGVALSSSSYNVFSYLTTSNGTQGIELRNSLGPGAFNAISDVVTFNNTRGVSIQGDTEGNMFGLVTATNNAVGLRDLSMRSTMNNFASIQHVGGLQFVGSVRPTYGNFVLGYGGTGVVMSGVGSVADGKFFGTLVIDKHGSNPDCDVNAGNVNPGITHDDCTPSGSSAFTLVSSILVPPSFVGKVTAPGDSRNASDDDGAKPFSEIVDWSHFENRFRGWGRDGGTFPSGINQREACLITETCRIWDWQLLFADPILRNRTGNGVVDNEPFVAGSTCPAPVHGDMVATDQHVSPNTYLLHASEILLDYIGDEDGLCESNETCLYTPNFGAYQGHGTIGDEPCLFESGVVSKVTMFAYSENGL